MIRVCITAVQNTPALLQCSPRSIVGCVIQASELQLEMSGPLGQCYMVPYWNKNTQQKEAQFQVGYRGYLALAHRSGRVQTFCAQAVHEGDRFQFQYGTDPKLIHVPAMDNETKPVRAVYSILLLKGGGKDFEVMSARDINLHRERYSKQKGSNSPWETAWDEMAKKTLIRRIAKRAPVSVQLQTAAVLDEYGEAGVPQGLGMGLGLPEMVADLPPENGRHRLGTVLQPEPSETPTDASQFDAHQPEDLESADLVAEVRSAIGAATSQAELTEMAGVLMTRHRERISEATYGALEREYQARNRELTKRKEAKR